jgi:hypothetical protein
MRPDMRIPLFRCVVISSLLLVGCGAGTATVAPRNTTPRSTVSWVTQTARAEATEAYCRVPSEGSAYLPPTPSEEMPFQSDPTENGERYTGGMAHQWIYRGLADIQGLYIRNTGNMPIPMAPSDFRNHGSNNQTGPVVFVGYKGPPLSVVPGQQVRIDLQGYYGDVLWTIGGKYGTVTIPWRDAKVVPQPTPKPGC